MELSGYLTIPQVARRLGYSTRWVRALVKRGKLPAIGGGVGKGRTYLVPEEAVERLASSLRRTP
jgi:excisionase family DNA binding protein